MTDERLQLIEQELALIKQRNAKVEANKAWEGSAMRIGTICIITYLVAATLLFVINADHFWLGALVPMVGFFLSTQSLPVIKHWWIETRYQPNKQR